MTPERRDGRAVVGVVSPYFRMFDAQMGPEFRREREAEVATACEQLALEFDLVEVGLVDSPAAARAARAAFERRRPDVLLVVPAMAAPPEYTERAVDGLQAPIVLWHLQQPESLVGSLDQRAAHVHTNLLGCQMFANVLRRRGTEPEVVSSLATEPGAVIRRLRAGAAAVGLAGSTLLQVGDPIDGYTDVAVTDADLAQLRLRRVPLAASDLSRAFDAVAVTPARPSWIASGDVEDRSLRLVSALRSLVERTGADAGTINCHGPALRNNERIGVPACLAVSASTADGVPFSCTGDLPTAIALLLGRRLAGAALYCEAYGQQGRTSSVLLANSGEADPALGGDAGVVAGPNLYYQGVGGAGTATAVRLPPGPATLLSLTPTERGWLMVAAAGHVEDGFHPEMMASNCSFVFAGGQAEIDAWVQAGAVHHQALLPGHWQRELRFLARILHIEHVHVGPTGM